MTTDLDLEAILSALPKPEPREVLAELVAARGTEFAQPPGIIPVPEHVYPPGRPWSSPVLAFACPHRCGWAHLVDPVLDDLEDAARPFVIPAGSPQEISDAITARANARAEERRERIEEAMREHLRSAHSDQETVRTLGPSSPPSPPSAGDCAAPPPSPLGRRGRSMPEERRD